MDAAFIPMLSRMQQKGMQIDRPHFELFAEDLRREIDELHATLSGIVGEKMNPNSPKIADLLFHRLGLVGVKLTKKGNRESIDDDVLGALKARLRKPEHQNDPASRTALAIIECVTDYRERQKLLSTYCLPILEHADRNDRIHTTLNYTSTTTGRLSSSNPINLMTLPNPDNSPVYGKRIKDGVVARPGYKLISVDYSSIEMVVGAHETQDRNLIRVFAEGLDPHKLVASELHGIPYDEVPKALRTQSKPLNFGAFYGLGPPGLQLQFAALGIEKTEDECRALLEWYFSEFAPGVMEWKTRICTQGRIDGYVRDMFGRLRWMPGLRSEIKKVRAAAEREATNQPIQSGANGIIRIASVNWWEDIQPRLWDEHIDGEVIMQVHDENLAEAPEEHAEYVAWLLAEEMLHAVRLDGVLIRVGVKVGDRWGSL